MNGDGSATALEMAELFREEPLLQRALIRQQQRRQRQQMQLMQRQLSREQGNSCQQHNHRPGQKISAISTCTTTTVVTDIVDSDEHIGN